MNKKGFIKIAIIIAIVIVAAGIVYLLVPKKTIAPVQTTKTFQGVRGAVFEGYDEITYSFDYPVDTFSISSKPDGNPVIFHNLKTGADNPVSISYEEGRGFTPQDYFDNELKTQCSDCVPMESNVIIPNVKTFGNAKTAWVIFPGGAWLFATKIPKPTGDMEKVLGTFKIVGTKIQQPIPQPQQ